MLLLMTMMMIIIIINITRYSFISCITSLDAMSSAGKAAVETDGRGEYMYLWV